MRRKETTRNSTNTPIGMNTALRAGPGVRKQWEYPAYSLMFTAPEMPHTMRAMPQPTRYRPRRGF
jgi:hypothetical protein